MGRLGTWLGFAGLAIGCGGLAPERVEDAPDEPPALEVTLRANRIVFNRPIRFADDTDELLAESHEVLDRVAELLAERGNLVRVQVQGHSSTRGTTQQNQELSARRAAAVAAYLRAGGVRQEITSRGFGETYPVCHEETDDCHERNGRVELFVDEQ
ncbi:MAG: OmpA family protein [Sandaracinaceae bacterium]|nr:OmpA family protein [Sandaracinaceae bacterium]